MTLVKLHSQYTAIRWWVDAPSPMNPPLFQILELNCQLHNEASARTSLHIVEMIIESSE
jgi:hypothetical protein